MTSSDLIWRLVEMLLHKENSDLEQIALDQAKNDNSNDIKQDEV